MQDQIRFLLGASIIPDGVNFAGYPSYVTYASASDIFGANASAMEASVRSSIPSFAALNVAASSNATTLAIQEQILSLQADLVFNSSLSIVEIVTAPALSSSTVTAHPWGVLPFGRGSVHISSSSPLDSNKPAINPNFFMNSFDRAVGVAASRWTRRTFSTPPLSDFIGDQMLPSLDDVPEDASDDVWLAFMKSSYTPLWHVLGTAAMMSKELGGVVDKELKVYGTANVRVVDASVLPLQISGHPTATIYAVAERAAEFIKKN